MSSRKNNHSLPNAPSHQQEHIGNAGQSSKPAKLTAPAIERSTGNADSNDNLTPTYNLKAVVNETNLKPDTLRAWERRYGLPQPERTSGGHRLYSQRDIDMLKWLIARQDEGLSISRAVKLWRQLEDKGIDPLMDKQYALMETAPVVPSVSSGDNVTALRKAWIAACMKFDEREADAVMAEAFALFPIETVCFELLQKGLAEIGTGWYEGSVTVQQEHFASALAIRRLETMVAATPPPTRNGRILAACPSEERHTFALLMITLLLRRNGWNVIYLGANVPAARLESTLAAANPHLVILSAQTLFTASTMLPIAILLQRERVLSAYGGAVFNFIPLLRERMPGYFLGEKLERVPHMVEQLLTSPPPMPMYDQASSEYMVALRHYNEKQSLIEAGLWDLLQDTPHQIYLKNANKDLGQNIISALTFGDMDLLSTNLEWVQGLLVNYHYRMPKKIMRQYIQAYHDSCAQAMDERGQVIIDWLAMLLQNDL